MALPCAFRDGKPVPYDRNGHFHVGEMIRRGGIAGCIMYIFIFYILHIPLHKPGNYSIMEPGKNAKEVSL